MAYLVLQPGIVPLEDQKWKAIDIETFLTGNIQFTNSYDLKARRKWLLALVFCTMREAIRLF